MKIVIPYSHGCYNDDVLMHGKHLKQHSPSIGRMRQEAGKLEASLNYTERPYLKTNKKINNSNKYVSRIL
jgi:hypothetical protein